MHNNVLLFLISSLLHPFTLICTIMYYCFSFLRSCNHSHFHFPTIYRRHLEFIIHPLLSHFFPIHFLYQMEKWEIKSISTPFTTQALLPESLAFYPKKNPTRTPMTGSIRYCYTISGASLMKFYFLPEKDSSIHNGENTPAIISVGVKASSVAF